ncbi:unnamed protein product [Pleuronectes platessa]|uniref:Uncharacterized protein n=1 Tax=Pleuronectes platessa TaxID=8262 RepID=A0A9N7UN15_PLEPL|nr:unnamed protein product [Pleuronectes platessa]
MEKAVTTFTFITAPVLLESMVARVAFGKSAATLSQVFVPIHCVWRGGCPWHPAALPLLPLPPILKDDNDKKGLFSAHLSSLLIFPPLSCCGVGLMDYIASSDASDLV